MHVFGLVHLENLFVGLCKLEGVIVQAPNLRGFGYDGVPSAAQILERTDEDNFLPCKFAIVDSYNTLQKLKLYGASITDEQFQDQFSKFPNISELHLVKCYNLKNIEIVRAKRKKFVLSQWRNLEQVKIRAPNLTEFNSMDHSYSKGLILVIFSHKTKSILIYEDPGEIVIPPSDDDKIFMVPMLRLETIIDNLLSERPNIMSILPCTSSILLQWLPALIGCPQKQSSGKNVHLIQSVSIGSMN